MYVFYGFQGRFDKDICYDFLLDCVFPRFMSQLVATKRNVEYLAIPDKGMYMPNYELCVNITEVFDFSGSRTMLRQSIILYGTLSVHCFAVTVDPFESADLRVVDAFCAGVHLVIDHHGRQRSSLVRNAVRLCNYGERVSGGKVGC